MKTGSGETALGCGGGLVFAAAPTAGSTPGTANARDSSTPAAAAAAVVVVVTTTFPDHGPERHLLAGEVLRVVVGARHRAESSATSISQTHTRVGST